MFFLLYDVPLLLKNLSNSIYLIIVILKWKIVKNEG